MKITILMGSPHQEGNTVALTNYIIQSLKEKGVEISYIALNEKEIYGCQACGKCQDEQYRLGCGLRDDGTEILEEIAQSDGILLATPIFFWFCTAQLKTILDRLYCMVKSSGSAKGSFLKNIKCGIVATHEDDKEEAMPVFRRVVEKTCQYSGMVYSGCISVATPNGMDDINRHSTREEARAFVESFYEQVIKDTREV